MKVEKMIRFLFFLSILICYIVLLFGIGQVHGYHYVVICIMTAVMLKLFGLGKKPDGREMRGVSPKEYCHGAYVCGQDCIALYLVLTFLSLPCILLEVVGAFLIGKLAVFFISLVSIVILSVLLFEIKGHCHEREKCKAADKIYQMKYGLHTLFYALLLLCISSVSISANGYLPITDAKYVNQYLMERYREDNDNAFSVFETPMKEEEIIECCAYVNTSVYFRQEVWVTLKIGERGLMRYIKSDVGEIVKMEEIDSWETLVSDCVYPVFGKEKKPKMDKGDTLFLLLEGDKEKSGDIVNAKKDRITIFYINGYY